MNDSGDPSNVNKDESAGDSLVAIEITGKDLDTWNDRRPRFYERMLNSVINIFKSDIPPSATANKEMKESADDFLRSAQEKIKSPQLVNQERQASISLKLAEAREREANTRKIQLEADKLEMEIEQETVHQSQKTIEILIQRGELELLKEEDGELILLYKGHKV